MQARVEELVLHKRWDEKEEERLSPGRGLESELLERVGKFFPEDVYASCMRCSQQLAVRGRQGEVSEEKGKI